MLKKIILLLLLPIPVFSYEYKNLNNDKSYINYTQLISDTPEQIVLDLEGMNNLEVFERPADNLKKLVNDLTQWTDHEYLKIKSIHDWISINIEYDWEGYDSANLQVVDPYITLRKQKAVCAGYANLFNVMCRIAGFKSYYITGYAKSGGDSKYNLGNTGLARHAWNSVQIEGNWYLVDTTWDSHHVDGLPLYRNDYLFIDPENIIKTHYPEAPAWLLIDSFISLEEFIHME